MTVNEREIEVLRDLVRINADRVSHYAYVCNFLSDEKTRILFNRIIQEGEAYQAELTEMIGILGGNVSMSTTSGGALYKRWSEARPTQQVAQGLTALVAACEDEEIEAQRVYQEALQDEGGLDIAAYQLTKSQRQSMKISYNVIKKLRSESVAAY